MGEQSTFGAVRAMNYDRNAKEFTTEFVINNLPEDEREHLLLKDVRNSICEKTGVLIAVRGRVTQPRNDGSLVDGDDKPLYLLITAKSKHQLTQAMQEIQSILASRNKNNGLDEDDSLEDKITVGIDVWPAQFGMKSRLLGECGEFVDYIERETGAIVTLRGKGSNYGDDNKYDEPLNVYIKYENSQMKEKTRKLVLNLIDTVQKDFLKLYAKYYAQPRKPEIIPVRIQGVQKSKNPNIIVRNEVSETKDFQSRNDTDKITIGFDCAPRNFDLKAKIYGPDYTHTDHIEKEGGALILLQGRGCRFPEKDEVDEPPHLLVKYQDLELKSKARELIFNLLESVQNDFIRQHGTMPIKPKKPQIVLYNPKPPQVKRKSQERSVSPRGKNSDHLRRPTASSPPRYQNTSSLSRRSKTPPPSRRPISPPSSRRLNSPPTSRRPNTPPPSSRHLNSSPPPSRRPNTPPKPSWGPKTSSSSVRRPNSPPPSSRRRSPPRRPHSPPFSRHPHSPPSSRHPHSPPTSRYPHPPPMSRHPHSPPSSRHPHSPPMLKRPNSPPISKRPLSPLMSKRPMSPPISKRPISPPMSKRPNSPPILKRPISPPMSKRPNSPPKSRRPNTPPKSSRRVPPRQRRSRSPVLAPPPPVISISEACNMVTPNLLPPVIPPLTDSTRMKPLPPPTFIPEDFMKPKRQVVNLESHHPWKTVPVDLSEPVPALKSPEFYLKQPKQPVQFVVPSFPPQSNFGQQKYVKKREISPESSTNNTFTQSKKYCPPFSSAVDKKTNQVMKVESTSVTPHKQMNKTNNRVRHRSLVQISFKEEFAVPQESSKTPTTSTNNVPVARFNGYDYKSEDTHQFAIPPIANVVSRKEQDKQIEKPYRINDNSYYSSDSEDGGSVICLDEDDDYYRPEKVSRKPTEKSISTAISNNKPMTFDVKVQTENEDEVLRKKRIQCVCGKFTHFYTGVRSRAVQTEPERYCRY